MSSKKNYTKCEKTKKIIWKKTKLSIWNTNKYLWNTIDCNTKWKKWRCPLNCIWQWKKEFNTELLVDDWINVGTLVTDKAFNRLPWRGEVWLAAPLLGRRREVNPTWRTEVPSGRCAECITCEVSSFLSWPRCFSCLNTVFPFASLSIILCLPDCDVNIVIGLLPCGYSLKRIGVVDRGEFEVIEGNWLFPLVEDIDFAIKIDETYWANVVRSYKQEKRKINKLV